MADDIFDRARSKSERLFGNIGETATGGSSALRGPATVDGGSSALRGPVTNKPRFEERQLPGRLTPKLDSILAPRGRALSGKPRRLGGDLPSILTRPFDKD